MKRRRNILTKLAIAILIMAMCTTNSLTVIHASEMGEDTVDLIEEGSEDEKENVIEEEPQKVEPEEK